MLKPIPEDRLTSVQALNTEFMVNDRFFSSCFNSKQGKRSVESINEISVDRMNNDNENDEKYPSFFSRNKGVSVLLNEKLGFNQSTSTWSDGKQYISNNRSPSIQFKNKLNGKIKGVSQKNTHMSKSFFYNSYFLNDSDS